jgi:putative endopeptidase
MTLSISNSPISLKKFVFTLLSSLALASEFGKLMAMEPTNAITNPPIPRFSVTNMDVTIDPSADFYHYAAGTWLKFNPIPEDKSRWAAFDALQQRNWSLLRGILDTASADSTASSPAKSVKRLVGDFYAAAINTNLIETLGAKPLEKDFATIEALNSADEIPALLAALQLKNVSAMFGAGVSPDEKDSSVYAFYLSQGGLSLPDKDYYLSTNFIKQRTAFTKHVTKMFLLLGESNTLAEAHALTILRIETGLAEVSKSRTQLRDPIENYHKFTLSEVESNYPNLKIKTFISESGAVPPRDVIIGQPEFFVALDRLVKSQPLDDWKTYLRWHTLHDAAALLSSSFDRENFAFYGTVLGGQPAQEPRWQRAARRTDSCIGEALGELFVQQYFPPQARARIEELISNLKAVFHDRLEKIPWMTPATREKALAKFNLFSQKIGYPDHFRDYSSVDIRRDDYAGNVERCAIFESRRELARLGKAVDKTEWHMTPQTVNAYYSSSHNEIVFPAGILQPPFFDVDMDDAVNYGGIGTVIGHEMTHGFDDQGRKFNGEGNLSDWWTVEDAKAFEARSQKLVDQYSAYEVLPGLNVNGKLTLGENIADLGGASMAFEALQRALEKDPAKRVKIDGFTPEQRFFISFGQIWRGNAREADERRRIVVDPHSPGRFRSTGPLVNLKEFYETFSITTNSPLWRAPELRSVIW